MLSKHVYQESTQTHAHTHSHKVDGLSFNYLYLVSVCVCVRREEMTPKQCPLTHISTHERTQKDTHTHTHTVALSPWPQLKRRKRNRRHSQFVKRSGSLEISEEMVTRPTQPAVTGSHLQVGGREQVDIQSNFNWV